MTDVFADDDRTPGASVVLESNGGILMLQEHRFLPIDPDSPRGVSIRGLNHCPPVPPTSKGLAPV